MTDLYDSYDQLCFMDSETCRPKGVQIRDVTVSGAHLYATEAVANLWTFAVGENGIVRRIGLDHGWNDGARLQWADVPDDVKRHYEKAEKGEAFFVAWNAAFDRQIWNGAKSDFPPLRIDMVLDGMAVAAAAGIPTKLDAAARFLGLEGKVGEGANLIQKFEPSVWSPLDHPEEWAAYGAYAVQDTKVLRDVFRHLLPLSREEWEQYWVSETINDRGVALDLGFCEAASWLVNANTDFMNRRIKELTQGEVEKVTEVAKILRWVKPILARRFDAYKPLIEKKEIIDKETGEVKRPEKLSLGRERIEQAIVYLETLGDLTHNEQAALEVLTLRLYGGSNTPQKFAKAKRMATEGRLRGQFVYNGAAQTGRFSARGLQVHNLTRSHLGANEEPAIEAIMELHRQFGQGGK